LDLKDCKCIKIIAVFKLHNRRFKENSQLLASNQFNGMSI